MELRVEENLKEEIIDLSVDWNWNEFLSKI